VKVIYLQENEQNKDEIFFDILFRKEKMKDNFLIPAVILEQTGRINCRLKGGQVFELLLRIASQFAIKIEEYTGELLAGDYKEIDFEDSISLRDDIYTDCYIVGLHKEKLLKEQVFDTVVEMILKKAAFYGCREDVISFLEKMLVRNEDYLWIEEAACPILLYKGANICYNVLNTIAELLGEAFRHTGQPVEYFDTEKEGVKGLVRLMGRHFRAVIGMQTNLFSVKMEDGTFLHDYIKGPKYDIIFDHPVWVKFFIEQSPDNFYIVTHDINYVNFIQRYFGKKTYWMPLAGQIPKTQGSSKIYDVTFVGSYVSYLEEILLVHAMPREIRFTANRFLLALRKNTNLTAEEALYQVYRQSGYVPSDEKFLEMLRELRRAYACVIHYFRTRTIQVLLEAGIVIDVFGSSWSASPLCRYENLRIHPDITYEESIKVWQQSKLSLNSMSWHKGGFTERMANIMLCGTVLVTEDTSFLKGRYTPGKDMLVYHLDELDKLPDLIKFYLADETARKEMAENGRRKAREFATWDVRAEEFIDKFLEGKISLKD